MHSATSLTLWQSSQLGETKRLLHMEGVTTELPTRTARISIEDHFVVIETNFPKGRIVDRRTINDDIMVQVLELTVKGTEQVIRTNRFFKKTGPPDPQVILG